MTLAPTFIREAAIAGQFYPGTAAELDATVRNFLDAADARQGPVPKAIIAPHAGYVYSGAVAASAYAQLIPAASIINRVVLLGPCHRVAVRGLALSGAEAFRTPLGDIPVDQAAAEEILKLPQVEIFDATHAQEHSLEVHLPFLQVVLDEFSLVPLVVGEASPSDVAGVIEALWGGAETVIVVSSDLSHYLEYDQARAMDHDTRKAIENLNPSAISRDGACGRFPVGGLLQVARQRGMTVTTLDLRNSGDTAGPKDRVVGYGSWMFQEAQSGESRDRDQKNEANEQMTDNDEFSQATRAILNKHGETLLGLAAGSIEYGLENAKPLPASPDDYAPELAEPGACFVTLKRDGKLRGCIGSSEAYRPLIADVSENGFRAAFKDPRFPDLDASDIDGLNLSISLLSPKTPMSFTDEADFLQSLRPNVDGLIIEDGGRRALFLPSVWAQLPAAQTFVEHLKVKAGMAKDHWSGDFKAWRFIAEEISADALNDPASIWGN